MLTWDVQQGLAAIVLVRTGSWQIGRYVVNLRQAILKKLKDAYQKTEIVERFSYGEGSCFRDSESDPIPILNRVQRGEEMGNMLRGAMNKLGKRDTDLLRAVAALLVCSFLYFPSIDRGWF